MLGTEEESSGCHDEEDLSSRHNAGAASAAAIKTTSQAASSAQSFSKEMEYFQSVRVNIGTIATYLVQGTCVPPSLCSIVVLSYVKQPPHPLRHAQHARCTVAKMIR